MSKPNQELVHHIQLPLQTSTTGQDLDELVAQQPRDITQMGLAILNVQIQVVDTDHKVIRDVERKKAHLRELNLKETY